jgi:hypothetical protein
MRPFSIKRSEAHVLDLHVHVKGSHFVCLSEIQKEVLSDVQILLMALDGKVVVVVVIIFLLHGLGRLTCSGIDALPSFPGASMARSYRKISIRTSGSDTADGPLLRPEPFVPSFRTSGHK